MSNHASDWLDKELAGCSPAVAVVCTGASPATGGNCSAVLAPARPSFRGLADTDSIAPALPTRATQTHQTMGITSWDELLPHW
jgi:hypothetical protein